MHHHPSYEHLYERVRYPTNIGEHKEPLALMADLPVRKFEAIDRHRPTSKGA